MFVYHESLARSIDEELDNDLVIEDAPDDNINHDEEAEGYFLFVEEKKLFVDEDLFIIFKTVFFLTVQIVANLIFQMMVGYVDYQRNYPRMRWLKLYKMQ